MAAASRLGKQLEEVIASLSKVDARFALIGGLALASHKVIRATQDIDLDIDLDRAFAIITALLRIADYFAEAEPQSLVARRLREVVRRGRLPLEDLLAELLPDVSQRSLFLQRAGVRDESDAAQSNY